VDNDNETMCFTARFNTRVSEEIYCRFIISFNHEDDSKSIHVPVLKNSGIIKGLILLQNKNKNVDKKSEFITLTDLPIDGNIKINFYSNKILCCDDYIVKYEQ
jgi:hypothetical protein